MLDQKQQVNFADLWKDAQPAVTGYVRAIVRDSEVTCDLVQNIAVVLLKKFESWDSSRDFLPWALGFAKFEILAHRRDSARCQIVFDEQLLDSVTELWQSTSTNIDQEETALQVCLEKLEPNARELVRLRYFKDLKIPQVADQVDSTAGAVRVALFRVRRQLMKCVELSMKLGDTK